MASAVNHGLRYRPDIDGLRSLAVIPVVLFHANLGLPGGFVGVDVFFVISGFLISHIIYNDMAAGRFTYADFYERRIRRLLPPAFVVFVAASIYALMAMTWFDAASFGKSLASAVLYVSNFNFYWETGYFNDDATTKLLLHTWSLAVEEQFYIVIPVLFVLMLRWIPRKWIVPLLAALVASSFAVSVIATYYRPMLAFYMLPMRAWELGLGGVLALTGTGWLRWKWLAQVLGIAGAALILGACFTMNAATLFPGWAAAVPVLGSAAILASADRAGTVMNRVLSLSPLTFVGRISYSLYLWHWPVMVAMSYGDDHLSGWRSAIAVGISFVLGYLSWRFIENPVRRKTVLGSRRSLFLTALAGSVVFVALGLVLYRTNGLESRFPERARLAKLLDGASWLDASNPCFDPTSAEIAADKLCTLGRKGVTPTFALIGDSHGLAFAPAMFAAADSLGISGVEITAKGYLPLPGRRNLGINYTNDLTPAVFDWLDRHPEIHTIVLTGYWLYEATSVTYRHEGTVFVDDQYDDSGMAYNPIALRHALERFVKRFPDRRFVLLDDVPSGRDLYAKQYVRSIVAHGSAKAGIPRDEAARQAAAYYPILEAIAASHDNVVFRPLLTDAVCNTGNCPLFTDDGLLKYSDGDHLSSAFAQRLAPTVQATLAEDLLPAGRPR